LWRVVAVLEVPHLELQVVAQVVLVVYWQHLPHYLLVLRTQLLLEQVVLEAQRETTLVCKGQILSFLE
jgi:hypothetical protein